MQNLISTFKQASSILDDVKQKKGSVQQLCLSQQVRNKKQMVALVSETLRCMFLNNITFI